MEKAKPASELNQKSNALDEHIQEAEKLNSDLVRFS